MRDTCIGWRRDLHAHPELGFAEERTGAFVAGVLQDAGIEVFRGLGGTGVVGRLRRGTGERAIALRADMDALPIEESTGLPYRSVSPGVMHACGHDGHTAMLLAAAVECSSMNDLDGTIYFVFQPAEEGLGGGQRMVEEGLFDQFPAESVYALHNWPDLPVGQVMAPAGQIMAAMDLFTVTVSGKGAHAAMPHLGIDSTLAAAQMVTALNSIVGRAVSPLAEGVVSVTRIQGGTADNVIAGSCKFSGTARWFEADVGETLQRRFFEICNGIAAAHGCEVTIDYRTVYPATCNAAQEAQHVRAAAEHAGLKVVDLPPSMASEDFAFMLQRRPGCYFWLGAAREGDNPPLHSPHFDFNDGIIEHGIAIWTGLARRLLGR
jgi:amidohydrolase